jgi:hypothetical protein
MMSDFGSMLNFQSNPFSSKKYFIPDPFGKMDDPGNNRYTVHVTMKEEEDEDQSSGEEAGSIKKKKKKNKKKRIIGEDDESIDFDQYNTNFETSNLGLDEFSVEV